ncbi:low molecular weight phosphotyrosine protein phosphatase [Paraburkholderia sp. D15]|uniref:arsenate reductase/protein-tyrosine-phosphatase family protein n=1 Tax=Paraburkholderia sp. D15 TaxID=2880218 RepID=UPI002478F1F1|nr:low molecular weight phosphotyrosine protein phosphatase [Paraburkholderia sp. D15]WGS48151.1 low molecular weight phosphotyrosine protein phosphatase [Paraburkholderia sp. D15]WKF56020.1 Low molecular weight protein-tyrosine-phosphatase Ptp [Paraburkholderia busanensis]
MFANVLIVCHANVCRSPAAEMLFKSRSRTVSRGSPAPIAFHSAGLRAMDGHGMDPVMRRLLDEQGVASGIHYSRRLNRHLVRSADLVLVSERAQVGAVEALDPAARGKVYPLGKWEHVSDVADPHGCTETAYRESLVLIEHLVMGWLKKIC